MVKLYYRLLYWRRRISRQLGLPSPGGRRVRTAARRMRGQQWGETTRPLRVFAVIVLVVLLLSALLGGLNFLLAPGGGLPF